MAVEGGGSPLAALGEVFDDEYQHPRRQGQIAMQIVFEYLVNGKKPERELNLLTNEIRIKENINTAL